MIPRVAASTMPTINPASNTSRNTMTRLASIDLFLSLALDGDQYAVRRIRVIVIEKFVGAWLQRSRHDRDLPTRDDDLLDAQVGTLKLRRRRVLILDLDSEPLSGRHAHLGGGKPVVFDDQHDRLGRRRSH